MLLAMLNRVSIRKTTWLPLDEVWEMMLEQNTKLLREALFIERFSEII